MKTKLLLGAGIGVCALAWAAKDPVIMTVNGIDVPKSEFEYLYNKNSQQQLSPQPLESYVDMFINYRLKVADAIASGVDTTSSFRQEMSQYRHDLAAPYLADSLFLNQLVREGWERSKDEVEVSHIMIFKRNNAALDELAVQTLDSLRNELLSGADFGEMAAKYSQDRGTNQRGGSLGYITHGRYPYKFELASYSIAPGEISEVVESPVGFHLIKPGNRRPAQGTVRASHILLMDQGLDEEEALQKKIIVDSIYSILQQTPGRFEELAMKYSDDKGSARQGGLLPWFGTGQMVPEFEKVAFETPKGEISAPFRTAYGWHIVYKIDEKGVPSLEEIKHAELNQISNPQDDRYEIVKRHQTSTLAKKHKAILNIGTIDRLTSYAAVNGLDSLFYLQNPEIDNLILLTIDKTNYPASDFKKSLRGSIQTDKDLAVKFINDNIEGFENRKLIEAEEDWLEANNADYRNLYREYCNGSLLYEASVANVWDKASKDKEGLEKFFEANRSDYAWQEPRVKGILVQAKNDSVAQEIMHRYPTLPKGEALSTLRKDYKGEALFERVLRSKGQDSMIDNLFFGAEKVKPSNSAYTVYFMLDGRLLTAPEEVADVKGQLTGDYQDMLEKEWIKELREKYPVSVNKKVLKKVKSN